MPSTSFCSVASISSPICLAVSGKFAHRLKKTRRDDLRAVVRALDLPWILPTANIRFRYEVENIAQKNRIELAPILECDSIMTIVRAVESGLGIAFIPRHYLSAARDSRKIISLDQLRAMPQASLFLWVRRAEKDRPYVRKLVKAFNGVCS